MQHVEFFDCIVAASDFERFMRDQLLPYWRSRGFQVIVYRAEVSLGPAQYALVTAIDNFASIDAWPEKVAGDAQGQVLMAQFQGSVRNLRAAILKDIEVS